MKIELLPADLYRLKMQGGSVVIDNGYPGVPETAFNYVPSEGGSARCTIKNIGTYQVEVVDGKLRLTLPGLTAVRS